MKLDLKHAKSSAANDEPPDNTICAPVAILPLLMAARAVASIRAAHIFRRLCALARKASLLLRMDLAKELCLRWVACLVYISAAFWMCSCGEGQFFSPDESPGGRFYRAHKRSLEPLTASQKEEIARLQSLGYMAGSVFPQTTGGVLRHNRQSSHHGLNLYSSGHGPEAVLMNMEGKTIHRWRRAFHEIWPEREGNRQRNWYRRVHLLPDGELLVIFEGLGLAKLDADSEVIWANDEGFHHDVQIGPDGMLYSLIRKAHIVPQISRDKPVAEHFVAVVAPDGRIQRKISLIAAFEKAEPRYRRFWAEREIKTGDIFHSNSIRVLKGRIADLLPAFAAGNVLISIRNMSTIAVLDIQQEKVVWAARGMFRKQHDVQMLENGNLLLFDNRRMGRYSAVREFEPLTMFQKWVYRGGRDRPFFSRTCGAVQRLPGGNTLITESNKGRAFEVTRSGETVWEFENPHRAGEQNELIASLFDMVRLPPDTPLDWADNPENLR